LCLLVFFALLSPLPSTLDPLRCMRWEYVDLEAKTITYPAHEMKMKQVHIVPLSMQAAAILEDIRPLTGVGIYVFYGASVIPIRRNA